LPPPPPPQTLRTPPHTTPFFFLFYREHAFTDRRHPQPPASLCSVQFGIQLLILIMVFMLFSGAYLFQVGLVGLQVREFRPLLLAMLCYALIYGAYAAVKLSNIGSCGDVLCWKHPLWSMPGFIFVSLLQKLASVVYYLLVLFTCAKLGDPVWYLRTPWINKFSGAAAVAPESGV
jgi:hypothetical protein